MPVILNEAKQTTGSSTTLSVPSGQHDYMLINFATAYNEDYSAGGGDGIPTRQTPSGGGGTWYPLGSVYNHMSYLGGEGYEYINQVVYAWYSYPTMRGSVAITVGGASNESGKRDFFYSLGNAKYYVVSSVQDAAAEELYQNALFGKQGSSCFSGLVGVTKYPGSIGPLSQSSIDANGGALVKDGNYEYNLAVSNRHRRYVGPTGIRWVQTGIDWNVSNTPCAGMFVSVNSVECL